MCQVFLPVTPLTLGAGGAVECLAWKEGAGGQVGPREVRNAGD